MTAENMNMKTRNMPSLSLSDLKSRSSDVVFSLKFVVYLVAIFYGTSFALSNVMAFKVIGIFILGLMFAHGVELQHQVLHNQGFKNRTLNEIVGIILGLPMLVSFAGYQASHLRHHKYLGTPQNKEFFDYGDQYGSSKLASLWLFINRFMMPSLYWGFLKNVCFALLGRKHADESPDVSVRINRDYLAMLAAIAVLTIVSITLHDAMILQVWLIPLLFVATPVHALIEMPEHYRCETSSTDPFKNTRTIQSNAFMNWYTNGNNYHVEHHMMPGLPIDRLQDLHLAIHKDIKYFHTGYLDYYFSLLRGRPLQSETRN